MQVSRVILKKRSDEGSPCMRKLEAPIEKSIIRYNS